MRIAQIDDMLIQLDQAAQLAAQEEALRLAKEKADRTNRLPKNNTKLPERIIQLH